MRVMLGIDTGGTYTDAVLVEDGPAAPTVRAKAKALTTPRDLATGIAEAVDAVAPGTAPERIGLVSISTTLATNALVEGRGGRVCLVLIGFDESALGRAGLGTALGGDPAVFIAGGHTPTGMRQAPLDTAALDQAASDHSDAAAFAVVAHFGTRNPEDEQAARDILATATGRPVTCGHELAQSLGGPLRAVTTLLNARLVPMIADLIRATGAVLSGRGIDAPLMLVRGDGSLVSAAFAAARPIETILSGPAASLVGAAWLTGETDAVISDIGGTTTDIAILREGRPRLNPDGAVVGGYRTMVQAVDMRTHGLGGDSAVTIDDRSLAPRVILGPGRLIPISLLATQAPELVGAQLARALEQTRPDPLDARFLVRAGGVPGPDLPASTAALLDRIENRPHPAAEILADRQRNRAVRDLMARGLVRMAGFTPSDAAHVLGLHTAWDREAAIAAASLTARQRTGAGQPVAPDAAALSRAVLSGVERRSAELLIDAALGADGLGLTEPSRHPLAEAALDGHDGVARLDIGLALPLIGLGASAPVYYPGIAGRLRTRAVIPEHADVANAVGAVVGRIRLERSVEISQPAEGTFRVHVAGNADWPDLESARRHAATLLSDELRQSAQTAGAEAVVLDTAWAPRSAEVEGQSIFIDGRLTVTATGRPQFA